MPLSNYLKIRIGDYEARVSDPEELPISITYSLEDPENFQNKKSSESFDIDIPAVLLNSVMANSFHLPDIEDLTTGQAFRSHQPALIESNGYELLVGRAFLKSATHNGQPLRYTYNMLGDNADWLVLLKDKTFYDFINHITFTFDKPTIEASWAYDGTNELLPYVFAPVRYRRPFGGFIPDPTDPNAPLIGDDDNVQPVYMRPALSKYWMLYWGFKSVGYRIQSVFLDSEYFRRQVMPWTWGGFLDSDSTRLERHKFLAKSDDWAFVDWNLDIFTIVDMDVQNDFENGAYDANNDYTWDPTTYSMTWTYNPPSFGALNARFRLTTEWKTEFHGPRSWSGAIVEWYVNGTFVKVDQIFHQNAVGIIFIPVNQVYGGIVDVFFDTSRYGVVLSPGDFVQARIKVMLYKDKLAINQFGMVELRVLQFNLESFSTPLGGIIDFSLFESAFNKRKWIDFLAGVIDEFNLSINSDPTNKVVYIEPTHSYSLTTNPLALTDGYFKNDFLDWDGKEDISQEWIMESYADIEKELTFKYKDDTNDGILKLIQDRNKAVLTSAKYVFPERFQTGEKDHENRFFSPTMHYEVEQWKMIGTGASAGIIPQLVCIIPENISQTSESESENTFEPKSCYYKGLVTDAGGWRWDGTDSQELPFMFAVNYQLGGENDPILSYCDENIRGIIGRGLMKRFFWQRLAIDRNGQRYTTWFRLQNIDVANQLHREYKAYHGQRWELIQIVQYKPLQEKSTQCLLYKWVPISDYENTHSYPSFDSIMMGAPLLSPDIKYARLRCLKSDIPTT